MASHFDAGRGLFEFFVGTEASFLFLLVETADFHLGLRPRGEVMQGVTVVAAFSLR
jgi:hypothetical protein